MTIDITETFYPKKRSEWRQWLTKNHDKKKEIWVIFYKKHTKKPTVVYQDAVDEALCFGWIDGMEKRLDEERYVLRFTPRVKRSNWSATNVNRFKALQKAGLVFPAGTAAFVAKKHVYTSFSNKKGAG